ncbi:UTP--glucose-1-phosphate uridylyltransferase GalU [Roseobacter sp. N2S]|uniref:UTP--glucose-1-phosphate uridylyltransferase GalU n=1 Tax=Roseobacter sp. N2S TaxID=2663844 RepID=UPI00285C3713|nr:UTP--glucose-1-phosphate uridylyltransferase GalU [Roseobacter sp. N2S]MDR6263291.1 UTP--glucose-1-phosphate uridylyltransferase [Roseobacter sp. N2S]
MTKKITKAIFPVAGLGTRFLPATKSIPKEILCLVDKPLIQYAIDEAREAGIEEFIFVTSRGKGALEDYFDSAPQLEQALRAKNKVKLLDTLMKSTMDSGEIAYIRQREALGLGHAVWCARRLIGDEPFAVILTDDVIASERPVLAQMVDAYQQTGGNIVAAMEVAPSKASAYGLLDIKEDMGALVSVKGMVEKPEPEDAPSNLAVIGRYILTPEIMRNLETQERGAGGEIQLTDAIAKEISNSDNVFGFRFEGTRYDCGSKAGFLQATVAFGLARGDLGTEFLEYLIETVECRRAAQ